MAIRVVTRRNDIARIAAGLAADLDTAVDITARELEASMKQRAPADRLRRGISRRRRPLSAQVGLLTPRLWWASFVEFGTRHRAARPFVGPAAEAARSRFVVLVGRALRGGR